MFRTWLCTTHAAPVTHTYRRHLPPPRGAQAPAAQQGGTLGISHEYHPSLHCSHEALLVCPSESTVQAPARAMENVPFNMSQHVFRGLFWGHRPSLFLRPRRIAPIAVDRTTSLASRPPPSSAPQNMHGVVRACDFFIRATGPQNGHPPFPSGENDTVLVPVQ